ncbi:MAG: DNA primase [Eggerthellaceae bacterium]|jgi:DNA primase
MPGSYFSDEDIQRVRDATNIVEVVGERAPDIKQRHGEFWCCCPIHHEKTPSFHIMPDSGTWYCFGCNKGGDVFKFIQEIDGVSFPDAVRMLADRAHITLTMRGNPSQGASHKARLLKVCDATASFYHEQLMRNPDAGPAKAREYLASRNMGGKVPKHWRLGFAPGSDQLVRHLTAQGFTAKEMIDANVAVEGRDGKIHDRFFDRVIFPITNTTGDCIAFGGRVIGKGEPKYLNSRDTPLFHKSRVLFGMDKAKSQMTATGTAIVVEGYTDVIALHEKGITNAVATLGTALTVEHIRMLSRYARNKIVYLFDGDAAGQRAADRALQFIDASMTPEAGSRQISLFACTLPDNADPAEYCADHSAEELESLIDAAPPLLEYGIMRRLDAHNLKTAEGRTQALSDALSVLAPIKDSLLAKDYAVQIAGKLRLPERDVLTQLSRLKPPRRYEDSAEPIGEAKTQKPQETLSESERNRLRFEREFLSHLALNPDLARNYLDSLLQIQWHSHLYAQIASKVFEVFEQRGRVDAAELVDTVEAAIPGAASVLTSGSLTSASGLESLVDYLKEELEIGDVQDTIDELRAQLNQSQDLSDKDREAMFVSITGMQKDLVRRRAQHSMPEMRGF